MSITHVWNYGLWYFSAKRGSDSPRGPWSVHQLLAVILWTEHWHKTITSGYTVAIRVTEYCSFHKQYKLPMKNWELQNVLEIMVTRKVLRRPCCNVMVWEIQHKNEGARGFCCTNIACVIAARKLLIGRFFQGNRVNTIKKHVINSEYERMAKTKQFMQLALVTWHFFQNNMENIPQLFKLTRLVHVLEKSM